MRRLMAVLALLVPMAAWANSFDGRWIATLSCDPARDALGYSYRFPVVVHDGVLHGAHGAEGQPGSLQLDGTVSADGAAQLYARSLTGSPSFVPGRDTARGTDYGYHVNARFAGASGTGTRLEGRPCTFSFGRE